MEERTIRDYVVSEQRWINETGKRNQVLRLVLDELELALVAHARGKPDVMLGKTETVVQYLKWFFDKENISRV